MNKELRTNKIFIDWSQNSQHKTTIAAYSLRGLDSPTVSTPVTWDEVQTCADGEPLSFTPSDVLKRVANNGDLMADLVS